MEVYQALHLQRGRRGHFLSKVKKYYFWPYLEISIFCDLGFTNINLREIISTKEGQDVPPPPSLQTALFIETYIIVPTLVYSIYYTYQRLQNVHTVKTLDYIPAHFYDFHDWYPELFDFKLNLQYHSHLNCQFSLKTIFNRINFNLSEFVVKVHLTISKYIYSVFKYLYQLNINVSKSKYREKDM